MYLKLKDRKFEQVRGVDFMREVLLHSPASLRHAFIGTSPENLIDILRYVESINPNLEAFTLSPNFELDLNSQIDLIIDFLLTKKPNFIWIGLGAPKQFIVTYSVAERLNLPTAAVGAAFDFITGNKREAPKIMRKIGLEWLFRLFQEPRRLFKRYFFGNASFLKLMIKDFLMHLTTSQGESTS
jgi:N-acetylglucosaminyldiphosphoundecaprenol N-acetyl-beta-D-mannosaminyltransferase